MYGALTGWSRAFALVLVLVESAAYAAAAEKPEADGADDQPAATEDVDFTKLKNPVPFTKKSIARGRVFYERLCAECHGRDGKALIEFISDATDLTTPQYWRYGTTPGEVFRSTRDGAGVAMPPYAKQIRKEEDIWHVVNFVQSLWPEKDRPKLQEDEEDGNEEADNGNTGNQTPKGGGDRDENENE